MLTEIKMPMIEIPREEDVIHSTIVRNIKRHMHWWTNVWVKEEEKKERLIMIKNYITSYDEIEKAKAKEKAKNSNKENDEKNDKEENNKENQKAKNS